MGHGSFCSQTIAEAKLDAERILHVISLGPLNIAAEALQQTGEMTMPRIETQVASIIPELLSSIDSQLQQYWKRWRPLLALFENTVRSKVSHRILLVNFTRFNSIVSTSSSLIQSTE